MNFLDHALTAWAFGLLLISAAGTATYYFDRPAFQSVLLVSIGYIFGSVLLTGIMYLFGFQEYYATVMYFFSGLIGGGLFGKLLKRIELRQKHESAFTNKSSKETKSSPRKA